MYRSGKYYMRSWLTHSKKELSNDFGSYLSEVLGHAKFCGARLPEYPVDEWNTNNQEKTENALKAGRLFLNLDQMEEDWKNVVSGNKEVGSVTSRGHFGLLIAGPLSRHTRAKVDFLLSALKDILDTLTPLDE